MTGGNVAPSVVPPPHSASLLLGAFRHVGRMLRMLAVLSRYDALFPFERVVWIQPLLALVSWVRPPLKAVRTLRPGQRLALALPLLGPSFIKLGQALSIRSDLVGDEIAIDLSALQDRLPPFSGDAARSVIEAALGCKLESTFQSFDPVPIAAASVAQVHFAMTKEGSPVAVKVLRPGIEAAFARDLGLMTWLAGFVERVQPRTRRLRPREVVRLMGESIGYEMDLRLEAAGASELGENMSEDSFFRVPKVDWARTSRAVLTLERVSGIPMNQRERLIAAGHDPKEILRRASAAFFHQVFRDGFFHGDLHPGNLFVDEGGNIVVVDFGIMGRIDRKTRLFLADILIGFLTGDYRKVAETHFAAGYVPADQSLDGFTLAARSIGAPLLGRPFNEISVGRLLAQLMNVAERFKMETQPQLLLLQKTMVLAEGVGRQLAPEANMWVLIHPLIERWMRDNRGPQARIMDGTRELVLALERLPTLLRDMEQTLGLLAHGGLPIHPETMHVLVGADRSMPSWPLLLVMIGIGVVIAHFL